MRKDLIYSIKNGEELESVKRFLQEHGYKINNLPGQESYFINGVQTTLVNVIRDSKEEITGMVERLDMLKGHIEFRLKTLNTGLERVLDEYRTQ